MDEIDKVMILGVLNGVITLIIGFIYIMFIGLVLFSYSYYDGGVLAIFITLLTIVVIIGLLPIIGVLLVRKGSYTLGAVLCIIGGVFTLPIGVLGILAGVFALKMNEPPPAPRRAKSRARKAAPATVLKDPLMLKIRAFKKQGYTKEEILKGLSKSGYSVQEIESAYKKVK